MTTLHRPPLRGCVTAGHPLVDQTSDLKPAWLTAVLRAAGVLPAGQVIAARSEPIGNGMVATTVRLHLTYDAPPDTGTPATLVAKMTSIHEASRELGAVLAVYEKEVRFYQDIAPRIAAACVSQALFADVDDRGEHFLLLLPDLFPARSGDQIVGCSVEEATAVLHAAATIHAPFWDAPEIDTLPWMNRARDVALYVQGYRAAMGPVKERYAHSLRAEALDVVERLGERIEQHYEQQPRPWTITHQDFRLDNLLFDAKGGQIPVAVLDWQSVRIGPGVSDVAYFIGAGLPTAERRLHERQLLESYRLQLCSMGVGSLSAVQAWEQYRFFASEGLITAVLAAGMVTPTERGDRMFITMIERHAQHMLDLETLSLIG